jgi:hypothetical protein
MTNESWHLLLPAELAGGLSTALALMNHGKSFHATIIIEHHDCNCAPIISSTRTMDEIPDLMELVADKIVRREVEVTGRD